MSYAASTFRVKGESTRVGCRVQVRGLSSGLSLAVGVTTRVGLGLSTKVGLRLVRNVWNIIDSSGSSGHPHLEGSRLLFRLWEVG
jgi:hypothetical protein